MDDLGCRVLDSDTQTSQSGPLRFYRLSSGPARFGSSPFHSDSLSRVSGSRYYVLVRVTNMRTVGARRRARARNAARRDDPTRARSVLAAACGAHPFRGKVSVVVARH